ncbi:MAG: hypothetical protein ACOC71_05885 [Hyphomicrobiales bacterium]
MGAVSRRTLLAGAGCLLAGGAARAHTPYRQWQVYRQKHLLIGTCRADPESYPLGKRLVSILVAGLPESKARVARARTQRRLASLLTTGQLEVLLLTLEEAAALADGKAPFAEFGPYPLRLMFEVDGHALVCGEAFPESHAWLVTDALAEELPVSDALRAPDKLTVHPGSAAFLAGEPHPEH